MAKGFSGATDELLEYADRVFHPEDEILRGIRTRAAKAGLPDIHVGRMDGLHLEILARACGSRRIVEIGTLAGYSGVCLARALPEDGKLFTFEFSPKHAELAKTSFELAGLASRVEILLGRAVENLPSVEKHGPFDLVFIDADKPSYPTYFEWAVRNLRKGGIMLADNTFAGGEIANMSLPETERLRALRNFNKSAATDPRLRSTLLPTSDGLTFSIKL